MKAYVYSHTFFIGVLITMDENNTGVKVFWFIRRYFGDVWKIGVYWHFVLCPHYAVIWASLVQVNAITISIENLKITSV